MHKYTIKYTQVNPQLKEAWSTFLDTFSWDWFTTLTFRGLPKSYTALNYAKKWLYSLENEERIQLGYFLALEYTKVQNKPHIHLLMSGLKGVCRKKWWYTWYTFYGAARILPYRKGKGCSYYLSKYIVKDCYDRGLFELKGLKGGKQ